MPLDCAACGIPETGKRRAAATALVGATTVVGAKNMFWLSG